METERREGTKWRYRRIVTEIDDDSSRVLRKPFIQEVIKYLQDSASRRDLQFLLAKKDAWKVVAEAELSRDEEAALRKALEQLPVVEDKERLQKELQDRKRFVEEFPQLKKKIEGNIRKLRALADHVDQVHKGCTISNVVTNTTSVASGVLGILGLALAPVTAGGSLLLSATGVGLGAVATVIGAATVVVEETSKWSDEAEAKRLLSDTMDTKKKVPILKKIVHTLSRDFYNVFKQLKTLRQNIRATGDARANPHLVADAKLLMTARRISAQQASQVKNVFEGTALAMTKKARIRGAAIAGVFLAVDVYDLVRESMHLYDGAKSESAKELRALAQELEEKVREIAKIHKTLQVS
ncbi:apolipoprotein L2-like [Microtus oregoni]|uniref:apolipoprotein L2-like n=1 Tax=Microtus oregoni TaxID=111838 RepID=UPI001BB22FF8|nr:apolipoprotein L2-like [Microtus oregoni]